MKKIILLFFALITGATFSQDFKITKSDIFKDRKKHSFLSETIEDGNGGIITVRGYLGGFPARRVKGYFIQHFDKNLKLIDEVEHKVDWGSIEGAFIKNNKIHLIEYIRNRFDKESNVKYNVLISDINKLSFTTKELISISKDNINDYLDLALIPFFYKNHKNQYDKNHLGEVIMSKNKNYFAINFDLKDKNTERNKVFVFNNDLELIYSKLISKNIKDKYFVYNNLEVDDDNGAAYFLGKSYENNSRKAKKDGKSNYHFELTKIDKDSENNVSFKTPDKFIGSLSIVKNNGKLSCVGFYGNRKEAVYNGVCIFNLDPTNLSMNTKVFNPFSETFMTDKYGDRAGKKKRKMKKGLGNIKFKNIERLDNGDLVINAEEDYITVHTTSGPNGSVSTTTVHHFDDIISFRLDTAGKLKWARNINKAQTGTLNSSFTPFSAGNKTYFFINCSDRIKKLSGDRISFRDTSAKNSNLYVISVSNNGEIDFKKLIDRKDSKVYYKVYNGLISSNKQEIIFLGKKNKNSQILKLSI
ncbi:hypothetical protein [Tenacibaculum geojense]|uniref:Uncharacterized protein n=1 Tax=Tenacibaculum geojense TaxID=915352 RepID=A0ABW3JS16_9FLAO